MRNKRIVSSIILITVLVFTLIGCGKKNAEIGFIENIIEDQYSISAFTNDNGIVKANLTGDLSRQAVDDIVKNIYSKAKEDNIKDKEFILNIYKDGENNNFVDEINENMLFNVKIYLDNSTYTIKSIDKVADVKAGNILGEISNTRLESAKDNNLDLYIDMKMNDLNTNQRMERVKTYIQLFLDLNKDKEISSLKLNVNSKDTNSYIYDTNMEDILITIDKDLKIGE